MKSLVILLLLAVSSCAVYKSYNKTTKGTVNFTGGAYKDQTWDQNLKMKRLSWYHGMSLYYDMLLWKADIDSPFAQWFSPSEKEFFVKCENFLVSVSYSADPQKISHILAREQMKLNGYDDVVVNTFANYLKSHPSAVEWKLENYKVIGYCKRAPSRLGTSDLLINFPGFTELEVDL
ncbi:MAG: hypothetical protein ACLGHN_04930 [Bacteriovoracia bacterium]